jgi:flavin reductase (DIM6/NTAB) family NADH-FMN oxidoreductase RutF
MTPPSIDPREYRNAVGLFASGVTIITTRLGDVIHGMTANAVSSVSLDPTLLLVCIDRRARLHDLIQEAGAFAVNILASDQETLSGHFAGRGKDGAPPPGLRFVYGHEGDDGGVPTIAGCLTAIRCAVEVTYAGGDHSILIGRVTELRPGPPDAAPLVWFKGRYRQLAPLDGAETVAPDPWQDDTDPYPNLGWWMVR